MRPRARLRAGIAEEKIIIRRLSIVAIAFGLLLAEGCMSQHTAALQQGCSSGDRNACEQVMAPNPRCTDRPEYCTPGLPSQDDPAWLKIKADVYSDPGAN